MDKILAAILQCVNKHYAKLEYKGMKTVEGVVGFCLLLLPLWESVIVLCLVVRYFMSIQFLQSS